MRVSDVVNQVRRRGSELTTLVRYPMQVAFQSVRKVLQSVYERAELPVGQRSQSSNSAAPAGAVEPETAPQPAPTAIALRETPYAAEKPNGHAAQASLNLPTAPLLKSRWNSYTLGACIGDNGRTRLYEGRSRSGDPVLIKEFQFLDYDFSREEIEDRKKAFERCVELNLKVGNGPDFRVVKLVDAIALPKAPYCYLITKPINHNTTLESYIAQNGPMEAKQLREGLRQILETLRFLHDAYRVHFANGESERGLPHGNLTLKSLLIRHVDSGITGGRQFFVYLTDLELWEHLFRPSASRRFHETAATSGRELGSVQGDLFDLGLVGLGLAQGAAVHSVESAQTASLESEAEDILQPLNDPPLTRFVQRLLGRELPFGTAENALHTLLNLPEPQRQSGVANVKSDETEEALLLKSWLVLAIALVLLSAIGFLSWVMMRRAFVAADLPSLPINNEVAFTTINGVTPSAASITYIAEQGGAWDFALARTFTPANAAGISGRQTLMGAIAERNQRLQTLERLDAKAMYSDEQVLRQIAARRADVGLVRLSEEVKQRAASLGLTYRPVSYDGLVVFVPFGDPFQSRETVGALGQTITLEELQQLYTSDTDTPQFRGKTVKLFISDEPDTVQLFEQLVLENNAILIQKFRALKAKIDARDGMAAQLDRQPRDVYNRLWIDFNSSDQSIGLGFDRLGRMFDQCSVYPLAIGDTSSAVSVLVRSNDQPIDKTIDLCGAKGSYFPSVDQTYPLRYELGMVYSANSMAGLALTEMLMTTEGQYLMSEVGLVPIEPIHNTLNAVWKYAND